MERLLIFFLPWVLCALPDGPTVVAGEASVDRSNAMTERITVSDRAILEYQKFDIGERETVEFVQPGHKSVVLNRVRGQEPSKLFGHLKSNGKVLLINPRGIVFGPSSRVDTGSLIASVLDIENRDFLDGNYRFTMSPEGKKAAIVNEGILTAAPEGQIVLIAPHILQHGIVQAEVGKIAYLGGETVVVDFSGDGKIGFSVEGRLESAVIEHLGKSGAGVVVFNLQTADHLIRSAINIDAAVVGNRIVRSNGRVWIAPKSRVDADYVDLAGHQVEIAAPLTAKAITVQAKQDIHLSVDLRSDVEPLLFSSPVILSGHEVVIRAPSTTFTSSLDGSTRLLLEADEGAVRLDGPVGSTTPLAALHIRAPLIDQNQSVRADGSILYRGDLHLGGGVTSNKGSVTLDGPVIRDRVDSAMVKGESIAITGLVNGDQPGRQFLFNSPRGNVAIRGAIGEKEPLHTLIIHAGSVSLADIGSLEGQPGVTTSLHITSKETVILEGTRYHTGKQVWSAPTVEAAEGRDVLFTTGGQGFEFSRGELQIREMGKVSLNTEGGNLHLPAVRGFEADLLAINTGSGGVKIGRLFGQLEESRIAAQTIEMIDTIDVGSLHWVAQDKITNQGRGGGITALGDVRIETVHGSVGTEDRPLTVQTGGRIAVRAGGSVYLEGESLAGLPMPLFGEDSHDSELIHDPSDTPFHNAIFPTINLLDITAVIEGIVSPENRAPSTDDFAVPATLQPRSAQLYYR